MFVPLMCRLLLLIRTPIVGRLNFPQMKLEKKENCWKSQANGYHWNILSLVQWQSLNTNKNEKSHAFFRLSSHCVTVLSFDLISRYFARKPMCVSCYTVWYDLVCRYIFNSIWVFFLRLDILSSCTNLKWLVDWKECSSISLFRRTNLNIIYLWIALLFDLNVCIFLCALFIFHRTIVLLKCVRTQHNW